ncbi:guanine nucleotide exchange factor MSS4-like [Acanthaster planci]|uniref:Guanine nucleotide exchange factor MSS4-like n=1 Tax=Acanthaster planci TaxID=133434 RepID=A0A8B7YMN6_ACAPL|nr:guanine nucleotide exchange factor MSS4-like [Acanthaster planci]
MAENGETVETENTEDNTQENVDVPDEKPVEEPAKDADETPKEEPNAAESKVKELTDEKGMNIKNLACARCQSIVLRPGLANATQKEFFLPHMKVKSANQEPNDGETLQDFWLVEGMYTFENVGFTNTVQNIKYLICADCEVGPIGCHELQNRDNFFVAVDRVMYT